MRVLLDACVWGRACEPLAKAGHDVVWAGDWPEDPGDEELLRHASNDERVVVTLDKDFGELAVVRGMQHRGIIRLVGFPAVRQGEVIATALSRYEAELAAGSLITIEPGRVRVRPGDGAGA